MSLQAVIHVSQWAHQQDIQVIQLLKSTDQQYQDTGLGSHRLPVIGRERRQITDPVNLCRQAINRAKHYHQLTGLKNLYNQDIDQGQYSYQLTGLEKHRRLVIDLGNRTDLDIDLAKCRFRRDLDPEI